MLKRALLRFVSVIVPRPSPRSRRLAVGGSLSLLIVCRAFAQDTPPVIHLGSIELSIGSPEDKVLASLTKEYDLQEVAPGSWLIRSKGSAPYRWPGSVRFENHRLASVSKDWSPADQEKGFDFANALYGAVTALVANGSTRCTLRVRSDQEPTIERKGVHLTCEAGRSLEIEIVKSDNKGSTIISESLE